MSSPVEQLFEADVTDLEAVMVRLSWVSRRRLEQELASYNLTVPQYIALRSIQDCGEGCSMSELAGASFQVSATMTGIVDRLVESGLVRRERDPNDRRTMRVALTPEGVQLLSVIGAFKRSQLRRFLAGLSPEERRVMIRMAERYLSQLEAEVIPT